MNTMTKREFLKKSLLVGGGMVCLSTSTLGNSTTVTKDNWTREATFYIQTPRGVKCQLCPGECVLKNGKLSICYNCIAKDDKLYTIGFGNPCGLMPIL